ncbi:hypothetical protein J3U37_06975 [Gilliamella sp. B3172]|uniref:T6SS immunity protein Tli4 family protein n=1 Tax=Gilliamella sp. B3172 TaxID=2818006 RepID=UPI0022698EB4|nr:T6SS immunity protein Tli4 family protein [Gilliamella sp. B3172]MCX8639843.1 hypothetical protein [Gilliamella sp. B3172]
MKKMIFLFGVLSLNTTLAVELTYKTECIGSYTLDLPDNLEVALYPTNKYLKPKSRFPIYFQDGKWAILSAFNYNQNNLSITAKWNDEELKIAKHQIAIENSNVKDSNFNDMVEIWEKDNNLGFYTKNGARVTFIDKNRIYSFFTNDFRQAEEKNSDFYKDNVEAIINGFSPRELFEVPPTAGKCIPFGFVAGDNSNIPLILTVSFRLKEHPDIVISFTENTSSFTNLLRYDAKEEINLFWNSNYDISNRNIKNIKLLGFPIKYRDIKMDGRNGLAGFVEIRYKDKSPSDYGYYGVVSYYSRNTSNSKTNHPWLQLSVIGKRSEAKGKIPLTEDEIYQMAKTIEASIKRRATEQ